MACIDPAYGAPDREPPGPDAVVAAFAAAHHGVAGRSDLLDAGLTRNAISRRVAKGLLHRRFPAVYAVGHPALSADGWRYAAVRACGPGAVASHLTAAALWGLRRSRRLDVTVAGKRRGPREIEVHETTVLTPDDATTIRAIPVTSLARTLVDLAEVLPADRLERVLDHAGRHEAFDLRAVEAALACLPGRHGAPRLRALLDGAPSPGPTRSVLEERFVALCRAGDLPLPHLNVHLELGGRLREVDALFAAQRVIVELDGAATHDATAAFHADRRRDTAAAAAGYQTLRYTWPRVAGEPQAVTAELRAVLSRRDPAATA